MTNRSCCSSGFTLVELAVVIAIVAILAAVAAPKLTDSTDSAERAIALDFVSQLNSAASMYTAKQSAPPQHFANFVTTSTIATNSPYTLSTASLKRANTNGCRLIGSQFVWCQWQVVSALYLWQNGAITATVIP